MGYHPRIESEKFASFLTTRTRNSELWFINNKPLEMAVLGYAAKYAERYEVKLYALAIEGNHTQGPAHFPKCNRSHFMRDLNSSIARAVKRLTPEYPGGRLWGRRYSAEFMPGEEDIEDRFFYTVLQPVQDGLVEKISEYPGYNCFHDAIHGIKRKFKVLKIGAYNDAKRFNPQIPIKDYIDTVTLEYARLPGYEDLTQSEYAKLMQKKFEERRVKIVAERYKAGKGFAGKENLLKTERGAKPKSTKTSTSTSHRPRVLSVCPKRLQACKLWYFKIYFDYRDASKRYREGKDEVIFPDGTYKPYRSLNPFWSDGAPPKT